MKRLAAASAALLIALSGCDRTGDAQFRSAPPPSDAPSVVLGVDPAGTERDDPVSIVVHVRAGIEAVAGAEAIYVEDALPSTDGDPGLRVERRFHSGADGIIRIRTQRTSDCVRGLWVRGRIWHRLLSSAGRSEPTTLLVNIGRPEPEYSAALSVVDVEGQPIAAATVTALLHPEGGPDPTIPRVSTDARGAAVLSAVIHDVLAVDVAAPGFATIRTWPAMNRAGDRPLRRTLVELPRAVAVQLHFAEACPGDAVMSGFEYQNLRHEHAHEFRGNIAHAALPVGEVQLAVYRGAERIRSLTAIVTPDTTEIDID